MFGGARCLNLVRTFVALAASLNCSDFAEPMTECEAKIIPFGISGNRTVSDVGKVPVLRISSRRHFEQKDPASPNTGLFNPIPSPRPVPILFHFCRMAVQSKETLSPWGSALAGALGAVFANTCVYPLDM